MICLGFYWLGIYSVQNGTTGYRIYQKIQADIAMLRSDDWKMAFAGNASHFLQPSRQPGDGVTVNEPADDGKLVLISGFLDGQNELRLIDRSGQTLAHWPASYSADFPDPSHLRIPPRSDFNIDLHGAVINPDGSVVFNYEYGGTVKKDRCGKTEWTLPAMTHHSLERASGGGYWLLNRRYLDDSEKDAFPPFTQEGEIRNKLEDLVLHIDEQGNPTRQFSILRALHRAGMRQVLSASGSKHLAWNSGRTELIHANKAAELRPELAPLFPQFDAGDLLLSLRNYNMLMVIDPDTEAVKWYQIGPWERQHDPEFNADGTISVFNNAAYQTMQKPLLRTTPDTPRTSNIMKIDPASGAATVVYGGRPGQEMLTVIRGKHDPVPGGGWFITEFEAGRAFETDAAGRIVWEYINRFDAENVAELSEAQLFPATYFDVQDWNCG